MKPSEIEDLKKGGVVKLKEKDMFSVWVKAVCNNMDSLKLRRVAEIAEKFGRGIILFTTRQLPIIPFVHLDNIGIVKEELKKIELTLDRCGARVRNADVCYDSNICKYAILDPISLGEKLDYFWKQDPGGFKIKISIVGCPKQCTSPRTLGDIGFVANQHDALKGYDAYLGGKLGLEPFIGIKMVELLDENECVNFVRNYCKLIKTEGIEGERSADLIKRVGVNTVKKAVNFNLKEKFSVNDTKCATKTSEEMLGTLILRVRATNGEVGSVQAKKIAEVAEKYGLGFVHFGLRGSPEIPGVKADFFDTAKKELEMSGISIIDSGVDNLQSCFGSYCTNGIFDVQGLLRKVEKLSYEVGLNNNNIKISASGCPNNCGISFLSDIGYVGVVDPEIIEEKCNGCGICVKACRVKAISIVDNFAKIDKDKCKNCDQCIKSCPFDSIIERRKGIAILVGGTGPHFKDDIDYPSEVKLAEKLIDFIDETQVLRITENIFNFIKEKNMNVSGIIDEIGMQKFKELVPGEI